MNVRMENQDKHLMEVMDNMIQTNKNVTETLALNNTIQIKGDNVQDFLNVLVNQVPVLNMRTYKANPKNTHITDTDVNVVLFAHHLVEHFERMGLV
jgi:hypothetical protein